MCCCTHGNHGMAVSEIEGPSFSCIALYASRQVIAWHWLLTTKVSVHTADGGNFASLNLVKVLGITVI